MPQDTQFPVSWGTIEGREVHDAGGQTGLAELLLSLEAALMRTGTLLTGEPIDFIVMAVPHTKKTVVEQGYENLYGGSITKMNGRGPTL